MKKDIPFTKEEIMAAMRQQPPFEDVVKALKAATK
jgi:hypothetical protein